MQVAGVLTNSVGESSSTQRGLQCFVKLSGYCLSDGVEDLGVICVHRVANLLSAILVSRDEDE